MGKHENFRASVANVMDSIQDGHQYLIKAMTQLALDEISLNALADVTKRENEAYEWYFTQTKYVIVQLLIDNRMKFAVRLPDGGITKQSYLTALGAIHNARRMS